MAKTNKYYNWEVVVWEESLSDFQKLIDFGVKGFISPLHTNEDGKPHYHQLFMFERQKTYDQVMDMLREDGLAKPKDIEDADNVYPINTALPIRDFPTRARYLCHLDNSDKEQLDPSMVTEIGGLDYYKYVNYITDKMEEDLQLFTVIETFNCTSYSQLVRYCAVVSPKFYKSVVGRCGFWSAYMRSLYNDHNSLKMEYAIQEKKGISNEESF